MKPPLLLTVTMFAVTVSPLRAQVVNDGATATLSNVTNNITGTVTVGTNGSFTLLVLSDNALLTNSANGVIGRNATAKSNEIRLTSATARWLMGGTLFVGSNGSSSRLEVTAGGRLVTASGFIGHEPAADGNDVLVTGAGSSWSNAAGLTLGFAGRANQLRVLGGATVDMGGIANLGHFAEAGSNGVVVAGLGSRLLTASDLLVGNRGAFNRLVVSNGGFVGSVVGVVGSRPTAVNNLAVVTGAGSVWSDSVRITIGEEGAGNQLIVSNGAVVASSNLFVGLNSASTNNRVVVNGGTLRASDGAGTGVLDVRRGTNVLNAGLIDVDRFLLTNTPGRFELLGGTLVTRGARVNNGLPMVIGPAGASPAVWDVRPGAFDHIVTAVVMVGNSSSGHQLLVSGGALLTNGSSAFIGNGAGANFNSASVSGVGSRWRTSTDVALGAGGAFNQLTVSDGGSVGATSGRLGASLAASSDNVALVTGQGSVWSNAALVTVGEVAPGNQLQIRNGGAVVAGGGLIGQNATANANTVLVSDAGSQWRLGGNLTLGSAGSFNTLLVAGGATVSDQAAVLGSGTSTNNVAMVTGAGSVWSNALDVTVGLNGPGNRLEVTDGGRLVTASGFIGSGPAAHGNDVLVTGAGSSWSNAAGLTLGFSGRANQLRVLGGGTVDMGGIANLGHFAEAGSNGVVVAGLGSRLLTASDLLVGNRSAFNRLVVSNGGFVGSVVGAVGQQTTAANNLAVVTGASSVWSNSNVINIGEEGAGNQLVVSNGGRLVTDSGFIGFGPAAHGNDVLVTGAGSSWSNAAGLTLGFSGRANQLRVFVGGTVAMGGIANLGHFAEAGSNGVVVAGPGSRLLTASDLLVGNRGAFNRLVVSSGGFVGSVVGVVGQRPTAVNNLAVVTGAGSVWSNVAVLIVGEDGSGNVLLASNGATVLSSNLFVGLNSASTNNRVTVNGGTLRAASPTGTGVLDVRRGTNVLNAGLVDVDQLVLTNKGTIPVIDGFGNSSSNRFGSGQFGTTNGLSAVTVAGYAGSVTKVSVTLSNLTHPSPDDLDILLVSPVGQKVMLMSDAGGNFGLSNVRLDFDDTAATVLPDSTLIATGTYRPTDYQPGETLPSPAPAGPYSTTLSSFNGSDPNGVWSLYLVTDGGSCCGTLVGWGMRIETDRGPFLDQGVFELNGGTLITRRAFIDNDDPFIVGGPGGIPATWDARAGASGQIVHHDLIVGENSSFNQLLVTNGAFLTNTTVGIIGHGAGANGNLAFISGAGSQWRMPGNILVGNFGAGNRLVIGAGGVVSPGANAIVGSEPVSTNNLLHISGGTLRVLNAGTLLDVRGGTNRLDAGLVDVNRLVITNTRGQFEFNGGTLRTPDTAIANGRVFTVGNGASAATLQLLGGTHFFSNNLAVANNASLIGNGTIDGTVTVAAGGKLIPGAPIGRIDVLGTVILQGAVNLQIDKSGGVRTNDQVTADGAIFYSGTLNVTDIGTDVLAAGDRFRLFIATPYVGEFTTLNLPPLGPGLAWANNLSVDGSIEVVAGGQPSFASISLSGTNVILAGTNGTPNATYTVLATTNVALPSSSWVSIATSQFDASGGFSFTNAILPGIPQRFFQLRTP